MNTILMSLIMMTMTYEMPKLPYANNALEPVISQQTIDFHYGKHLQTYVNNLNSLVPGTEYEGKTVEEIVAAAPDGAIFNLSLIHISYAPTHIHSQSKRKAKLLLVVSS